MKSTMNKIDAPDLMQWLLKNSLEIMKKMSVTSNITKNTELPKYIWSSKDAKIAYSIK